MLVRLIYASRVREGVGHADIKDILAASARNNARVGVTGALCFTGDVFLQCLEGHRREVNEVYHRILGDTRHQAPALLLFDEIVARDFGAWNMGYVGHTPENRALFLKYSPTVAFDPYAMSSASLRAFFTEVVANAKWLSAAPT